MSFIRKKIIDGKDYYYQVKSVRVGDKVIQKHIKYWGTQKPSKEQMVKVDILFKKGKLAEIKKKPIPKRENKEKERKKINEKRKSELKEYFKIFEKNKNKYSYVIKEELRLLLSEKKVDRWTNQEWKNNMKMITSRLEDCKILGTKEEKNKALNEALILMKKTDDVKLSKRVRGNAEVKLHKLKDKYDITFIEIEEHEKEIKKQQYKKPTPKEKYHGWDRENISKDIIAFFDKSGENEITVAKMSTGEWEVNPSTIIFKTKTFKTKKEAMEFAKEQMEKHSPEKPKILLMNEKEFKKEYIKNLKKISPQQPESWYKFQADNQWKMKEKRENKRSGDKVNQKVLKYLGTTKPNKKELEIIKLKESAIKDIKKILEKDISKKKTKLGTTFDKDIKRLEEIEKMIKDKKITEENWREISDEVYEMVAVKLETDPSYEQKRHDRYGKLKSALRKAKNKKWKEAMEVMEETKKELSTTKEKPEDYLED